MSVEKKLAISFITIATIILGMLAILSDGYEGGADTIGHYLYSRHALTYPLLLLDLWGRPVFTLLGIPFAYLGFTGMKFFSVILSILTAWFGYKILSHLEFKGSYLYIPMLLLAPFYLLLSISPLTETLFGFALILSIWLYFNGNFRAMALIISFIPFIRFEGFVIFPAIILALTLKKRYKDLPFLLTGYLLFTIIGYFVYNDLFWLINRNPYTGSASGIYGNGTLFFFALKFSTIFGLSNTILILIGTAFLVFTSVKLLIRERKPSKELELIILAGGSLLAYYAAHSYVWWKGEGNSLGLLRVMVSVIPVGILIASYTIHIILKATGKYKYSTILLIPIIIIPSAYYSSVQKYPLKANIFQSTTHDATNWIKDQKIDKTKVYYYSIQCSQELNLNVFEEYVNGGMLIHFCYKTPFDLPDDIYYLWDSQFGPKEGGVKLSEILNNKNFTVKKYFAPDPNSNNFKQYPFEIVVFHKSSAIQSTLSSNLKQYLSFRSDRGIFDNVDVYDDSFENIREEKPFNNLISQSTSFTGKSSIEMKNDTEFLPFNEFDLDFSSTEFKANKLSTLNLSVWIKVEKPQTSDNVIHFVVSQENNSTLYYSVATDQPNITSKDWINLNMDIPIDQFANEGKIKVYLWNPHKSSCFVDDFSVKLH